MGKTVSKQGMTFVHDDELLGEQGLRIRAVEIALRLEGQVGVDRLLETAEKVLDFITVEDDTDD